MCQNPFRKCKNPGCEVIILYKGIKREICSDCWKEISDSDLEWSEENGNGD